MPPINDPPFLNQWALTKLDAMAAWDTLRRKGNLQQVTVAIPDWGVQPNHKDLAPIALEGARVIAPENGDFSDDSPDGHGTMLAGLIAGLVPGVKLLVIKFIDACTPPTADNAAKAIRHALDQKGAGPMVINASWDVSLDYQDKLAAAIKAAGEAGVLIVAGAGNDGGNNDKIDSLPASFVGTDVDVYGNLVSVMASDENDEKPEFSNYGATKVHLAAPGTDIISTSTYLVDPPSIPPWSPYSAGFGLYDGTSAAAAFVSAAAAMMLSIDPKLTPRMIRDRLVLSAARSKADPPKPDPPGADPAKADPAKADPAKADRPDPLSGLCLAGARLNLSTAISFLLTVLLLS